MRTRPVATHVFVDDNANWPGNVRRCGLLTAGGERCSMPENNRIHRMPDTSEQMDEHRRRAGLDDTESESGE